MNTKTVTLAGLAVCAACGLAAGAGEPRSPESSAAQAVCDVTFRPAAADAGGLHLCLRAEGGRFPAGVTVGPLGPTEVDCAGLALAGNAVTGTVKVTVGFDGYYPKDGKPRVHEYRLNAVVTNGALCGTYEGTVTPGEKVAGTVAGKLSSPPAPGGYWVIDLQMENGRGAGVLGPKSYGERVYPRLFLKDGRFVQNLIYGWGQRVQINYFESAIVTNGLRFDGKTLAGPLTVRTTGGSEYVFTFDGMAVGTQIGGVFRKHVDGKEHAGGPFHGRLQPLPARPPDQAVYYLELHRAVHRTWVAPEASGDALQLMVSAPCVRGKFGDGVAYAAAWNHAYHDLDAGGLKREGAALTGELKVSMHPDPYMPPDRKPVAARYSIAAKIVDDRLLQGTFTGTFKDREVSGPVYGELLDQPTVPEPVSVHLKLEEGVNGGAPWYRRTWVNFTATNGIATAGSMSNNKGGWKGAFKKAEVKFEGAKFTAIIEGSVDETAGPEKGGYTFKLAGKIVGSQLVGSVDTWRDGKATKSGTDFMGGFHATRQPPEEEKP